MKLSGPFSPPVADFDQIANQVEKLLATGQLIHLSGRHDREFAFLDLLNVLARNRNQFPCARHVAEHQLFRGLFNQQSRDHLSVNLQDRDGLKALADDFGRV